MIRLPEVDTDDEDIPNFALTFHWKRRIFRDSANQFEMYDDGEFFNRFRLSKTTVNNIRCNFTRGIFYKCQLGIEHIWRTKMRKKNTHLGMLNTLDTPNRHL